MHACVRPSQIFSNQTKVGIAIVFVDTTYIEDFKKCEEPVELVSVAAVIANPWVDIGHVEDLKPEILNIAPKLGDFLVKSLLDEIGSPERVLAYGKASMTGMRGSLQHASALIHTLHFGNKFITRIKSKTNNTIANN